MPIVLPITMYNLGISGGISGFVLALPSVCIALVCPFFNKYVMKIGLEKSILYASIGYVISLMAMGWGVTA